MFETLYKWNGREEVRLSTPQIKQIAGRAGRFGFHMTTPAPDAATSATNSTGSDDSVAGLDVLPSSLPTLGTAVPGEVTCLDEADMPLLHKTMQQPIVQVTQASLGAAFEVYRRLHELLPADTPLSTIGRLVDVMGRTLPHYRKEGRKTSPVVADSIQHITNLTFSERYGLCLAPVGARDVIVLDAFVKIVETFSSGSKIDIAGWTREIGIDDALAQVKLAIAERERNAKSARWAAKREGVEKHLDMGVTPAPVGSMSRVAPGIGPSTTSGNDTSPMAQLLSKLAVGRLATSKVFDPTFLQQLESYHRCLTVYLWLSYRFETSLPDREPARQLRLEVERGIQFVLEGMRHERDVRGRARVAERQESRALHAAQTDPRRQKEC